MEENAGKKRQKRRQVINAKREGKYTKRKENGRGKGKTSCARENE